MIFQILGKRYHAYDPMVLERDITGVGKKGEVIDDGKPKVVKLGSWSDKKTAQHMAESIKSHRPKRTWEIWVEEKN